VLVKFNGPKVLRSRRIGVALVPKARARIERDLAQRPKRLSEYGLQLLEKQRLRFQYNVSERQMRRYYGEAKRSAGPTGANLVVILERRLDAFVLRSGFAPTIFAARQLVGHGHFRVNGRQVDRPSQLLRPGDLVAVHERSRKSPVFEMDWHSYAPPTYIDRDEKALCATLARLPDRTEVPVLCEEQRVVEYYSR
jgi:small subunit ribosomal protein S4